MSEKPQILLSVVSIGRNEARNLSHQIKSLEPLKSSLLPVEFIYVDSNSTDDSRAIAKSFFDKVILVTESNGNLSASVGRNIGTQKALGKWVLYLDGDFELYPEFIKYLNTELVTLDATKGYTGFYNYFYETGSSVNNVQGYATSGIQKIDSIGGGILLPKDAVLKAGNWSLNLYANEEVDLQVRLEKVNCYVYSLPINFIKHNTDTHSLKTKVMGNVFPVGSYLGKKFYGPGQVMIQALKKGYLTRLLFKRKEVYFTSLFQILCLLMTFKSLIFLPLMFFPVLIMAPKHGINRSVAFALHLPQVVFGWFRFIGEDDIHLKVIEE